MKITTRTLCETKRLLSLRDSLGLDVDDETLLALAERARCKGRNPEALFRWMLRHPESRAWISDDDRARARQRLTRCRPPAKPAIGKRTYADSLAFGLRRWHGTFASPQASSGWQAEAALIARAHDERLRRRVKRERWERVLHLVVVAGTLLWLLL